MSLADTAVLAVELKLNGVTAYTSGMTQAEAATSRLNASTTASGGKIGAIAGVAGKAEKGITSLGGAMSHAAGKVGGLLSGPLGLIGLTAGVFSLGGVVEGSVKKLEDFTLGLEKVQGLTGETASQAGALILEFQKFGISSDQLGTMAGFAEKTLGKLETTTGKVGTSAKLAALEHEKLTIQLKGGKVAAIDLAIAHQKAADALNASAGGTSKLVALDKQYGLQLVDSTGKVVDFSTELSQLATFYDGSASASTKAYVASQLFGRGYAAMLPILQQGAAGIRDAAAQAQALGLDLGGNVVDQLNNFRDQMRTLGEQVSVVQLKIGMALIPVLSQAASALSDWLSTGGTDQIVGFFKNAATFAAQFGDAMRTLVIPAFGLLKGAWDSVPGPLKDLLIAGFVANKAGGFLFDKSLFSGLKNVLGGAAGGLLGKGGSPANPLWVASVDGGLGGAGGVAGVTGKDLITKVAIPLGGAAAVGDVLVNAVRANPANATPQQKVSNFNYSFSDLMAVNQGQGGGSGPSAATLAANSQAAFVANQFRLLGPQVAGNTSALEANTKQLYDTSAAAHAAAKAAIGGSEAAIHKFILELRSGNTSVAIKDFPRELTYLQSVDDKMKMTPGFHRTLVENIANLKRDMVGATASQKAKLSADIKALQALDSTRLGAINATLNKIAGLVVQYGGFGSAGAQASHSHPGHNHGPIHATVSPRSILRAQTTINKLGSVAG